MRLLLILPLALFVATTCNGESKEMTQARERYGLIPASAALHVGQMTEAEVDILKAECRKIRFPASERGSVINNLIPKTIRPKVVMIDDSLTKLGDQPRGGGMVVDYWLNESTVLRAGIAYGHTPEERSSYIWVKFIDAEHAYTDVVRLWPDKPEILAK